jgi:Xaa-Pro aminopeptidase
MGRDPERAPVSATHRRQRLLALLDTEGLDAIVATTPENVFYATGFRSVEHPLFHGAEYYAVVTRQGSGLVVPLADVPAALAGAAVDRVECYGRFVFEYAEPPGELGDRVRGIERAVRPTATDALTALLDALGGARKGIGLDEAYVLPPTWATLCEALTSSPRPASALFRRARMVKSPDEVAALTRAARIAEDGIGAVLAMLRAGVTERQAAQVFHAEVVRQGALPYFTVIAIGERSAIPDVIASDHAAVPGALVRFDLGCVVDAYRSDIARTAVIGAPTDKQRRYYAALLEGQSAAIAALAPGRTAGEIFEIAVSAVHRAGLAHYRRTHVGHGIGLEAYDPPTLRAGDPTRLEPGMVFCVETPYYEWGWGGMQVEDLVEITETGHRVLTRSSRALAEVPGR